jgi:hypothetical protein
MTSTSFSWPFKCLVERSGLIDFAAGELPGRLLRSKRNYAENRFGVIKLCAEVIRRTTALYITRPTVIDSGPKPDFFEVCQFFESAERVLVVRPLTPGPSPAREEGRKSPAERGRSGFGRKFLLSSSLVGEGLGMRGGRWAIPVPWHSFSDQKIARIQMDFARR